MASTPSNMIPLGTPAPDFYLPDTVSGKLISLDSLQSEKALVILFICNHCPYVKHINAKLVELAKKYQALGVNFAAISSNDVANYPNDSPEKMRETAAAEGYPFPYLYDETQAVAQAYDAACTPDLYVFDKDLKLAYRGQFDSSRPKNGQAATGEDLARALDYLLAGRPLDFEQIPSLGCNIKWKK